MASHVRQQEFLVLTVLLCGESRDSAQRWTKRRLYGIASRESLRASARFAWIYSFSPRGLTCQCRSLAWTFMAPALRIRVPAGLRFVWGPNGSSLSSFGYIRHIRVVRLNYKEACHCYKCRCISFGCARSMCLCK